MTSGTCFRLWAWLYSSPMWGLAEVGRRGLPQERRRQGDVLVRLVAPEERVVEPPGDVAQGAVGAADLGGPAGPEAVGGHRRGRRHGRQGRRRGRDFQQGLAD